MVFLCVSEEYKNKWEVVASSHDTTQLECWISEKYGPQKLVRCKAVFKNGGTYKLVSPGQTVFVFESNTNQILIKE